jgi:ATP-dependent DNA ligase
MAYRDCLPYGMDNMSSSPSPSPTLPPKKEASFVAPMDCLAVHRVPEGSHWIYEVRLDGLRAIGVKSETGALALYSRQGRLFNRKFPHVAEALNFLPRSTVLDGKVVALDDIGRPNFNLLKHSGNSASRIYFYVFDLLFFENRDTTRLPLFERRELLKAVPLQPPMRLLEYFQTSADEMLDVVRQRGLEGVVAKQLDSLYEPGRRSGAWVEHRIAQQEDFVIGGFIPGPYGIDSLVVGEYRGKELWCVARVCAGLVPTSRREVFGKLRPLVIGKCPFVNLPKTNRSRWGDSLTTEKMKESVWVEPKLSARIEFLERTEGGRLRHSSFVGFP